MEGAERPYDGAGDAKVEDEDQIQLRLEDCEGGAVEGVQECEASSDEGWGWPLPMELNALVFSFLSAAQRLAISHVCQAWRATAWINCEKVDLSFCAFFINNYPIDKCPLFGKAALLPQFSGSVQALNLKGAIHLDNRRLSEILRSCSRLQSLSLMSCTNRTNDSSMGLIADLIGSRLLSLNIQNCRKVTSKGMLDLAEKCPGVTALKVQGCHNICKSNFDRLPTLLPHLRTLNISGLQDLNKQFILNLAIHCTQLQSLQMQNLNSKQISERAARELVTKCSKLRKLNLKACAFVNDDFLRLLGETLAVSLETLEIQDCPWPMITDDGLQDLCSRCIRLRRLNIIGCRKIGDSTVTAIAKHLTHIQELEMKGCVAVTDDGIADLAQGVCNQLHTLNLEECARVTDESLCALLSMHVARRTLNLGNLRWLTDATLRVIAKGAAATQLRTINLSHSGITNQGVELLLGCCPELEIVVLTGCAQLTSKVMESFIDRPRLHKVALKNCPFIMWDDFVRLQHRFPKLRVILDHN